MSQARPVGRLPLRLPTPENPRTARLRLRRAQAPSPRTRHRTPRLDDPARVRTRAFQNPGFSVESGIYPDISGYIRWNLLAIQCETKTEDTAGKLTSCSGSLWKD